MGGLGSFANESTVKDGIIMADTKRFHIEQSEKLGELTGEMRGVKRELETIVKQNQTLFKKWDDIQRDGSPTAIQNKSDIKDLEDKVDNIRTGAYSGKHLAGTGAGAGLLGYLGSIFEKWWSS